MPLIDSDTWQSAFRSLNQLHFHPANPRLPELKSKASERDIIHELCIREDVESLARYIADKGFLRHERLIVLVEGGKNIVYEGNRRLCALKLLANPDKAPRDFQKAFRSLAERAKLPKKIAIEIVPSKFDAEVVMFSKHALDKFVKNWKPIQQATFIASKLDDGITIHDLSVSLGIKRDEIVNAKAAVDLLRFCSLAKLSDKAKRFVEDPAAFPYSIIFERLFLPKAVREKLKVEINDSGLKVKATPTEFVELLRKILEDIASDELNTRTLNTVEEALSYVEKLSYSPSISDTTGVDEAKKALDKSDQDQDEEAGKYTNHNAKKDRSPAQRKKPISDKLFPSNIGNEHDQSKLDKLIDEGKKMKIQASPHAAAFLLRSTLEIALTVSIKHHKHYGKIEPSNPKHGPSLADMLAYLNKNPTILALDPTERGALAALVSRPVKASKAQLDRIVHSPIVTTHTEEVESIRELVLPLLHKLLKIK